MKDYKEKQILSIKLLLANVIDFASQVVCVALHTINYSTETAKGNTETNKAALNKTVCHSRQRT